MRKRRNVPPSSSLLSLASTRESPDSRAIALAPNAARRPSLDEVDACSGEAARVLMRRVRLPTAHHLACASLRPLRALISSLCANRDPALWAGSHVLLGCALRIRSRCMTPESCVAALAETQRAFDEALTVYCTQTAAAMPDAEAWAKGVGASTNGEGSAPTSDASCPTRPDGVQILEQFAAMPVGRGTDLLENAMLVLRKQRAHEGVNRTSWAWLASTNNLACALVLFGNRLPASKGLRLLNEAVEMLREAIRLSVVRWQREDQASTYINLSEALMSIAERVPPSERLHHLEEAVTSSADALLAIGPRELAWLVHISESSIT